MRSSSLLVLLALVCSLAAACGARVAVDQSNGGSAGTSGAGASQGAGALGGSTATSTGATGTTTDTTGTTTASTTSLDTTSVTTTTTTTTTGPDIGPPSDMYPAPHPPVPNAVSEGGPVIASPKLQPIFFSNDDGAMVDQIKDYLSKIGGTSYWSATTSEYGVGPATMLTPVMLGETATGTVSKKDVATWLKNKLDENAFGFATPDANTVYVLVYPAGFTITQGPNQTCKEIGGYHDSVQLDIAHQFRWVPFAVLPRCMPKVITPLELFTIACSHELIEAVTDPIAQFKPAYAHPDDAHRVWEFWLGGGEVADLCQGLEHNSLVPADLGYTVQRSWSNKAVNAGHDPCQPELPGEVYFNAPPEMMNDDLTYNPGGPPVTVKGLKLAVGATATVPLDLFSDGPLAAPFTISVQDGNAAGGLPPLLDLELNATQGLNGQKPSLTIHVNQADPSGIEAFYITCQNATTDSLWIGVVGQ